MSDNSQTSQVIFFHDLILSSFFSYMYWLNKVENRIESAWMDGQFLSKNPFHETFANDPKVTVAGLTLDAVNKMLYYLRVWQERCEIVSCRIHHRSSCKVVATPDDASHLAVFKVLFWGHRNLNNLLILGLFILVKYSRANLFLQEK